MSEQPESEVTFEAYLRLHGYAWEYEPDLAIPGRPDYVISRGRSIAVCEVKEFETTAIRELGQRAGGPVTVPPRLLYRTIRAQVRAAARKMRPLADRALPLVIVLSNPQRATVVLDPRTLFHALYGVLDPEAPAPPAQGLRIHAWPMPTYAGRGGVLTAQYPFISAVAVLHGVVGAEVFILNAGPHGEEAPLGVTDRERPIFLHVMHAVSEEATPVPDDLFDAPYDAHWKVNEAGAMAQVFGLAARRFRP